MMNLMDLLSGDSASLHPEQDFGAFNNVDTFYENVPQSNPPQAESNPSLVYYIPTEMTPIQKDMTEATVQMFKSTLERDLMPRKERSNINSLLSAPDDAINGSHDADPSSQAKTLSLIYSQLQTICMHPALVVDHFIPKGLLLSSTKARICSLSGKLTLFDRIVDVISEKYELHSPAQDYNLMVIAKSIKELELIEGLLTGKKLRYRNVSNGKRLYEEETMPSRPDRDELPDDEQTIEYKHRHQHFEARRSGKSQISQKEFVLHLITSSHLCSTFASDTKYDFMVSFDSALDVASPGVELLRSSKRVELSASIAQPRVPILFPTPLFSVEHLSKVIPKPETVLGSFSSNSEADWRRRILSVFVANRHLIYVDRKSNTMSTEDCKAFGSLEELIFKWESTPASSPFKWLQNYTKQVDTSPSYDTVKTELGHNYLKLLGQTFGASTVNQDQASITKFDDLPLYDYEGFKRLMARFMNARLTQIAKLKANAIENHIPKLRETESQRQVEIDADEDSVGENYRKLRKLNEEVSVVDKRFTRVENENQKLQEAVTENQQMFDHLQNVLNTKTDDNLSQLMAEQDTLLEQLEKEKTTLTGERDVLAEEIEVARDEYQQISTQALQVTERLSTLKAKQVMLHKRAEGPGMLILPSLARKDEISNYETQLCRLNQETSFLNGLFASRFEKLVKERNLMVDTTAPISGARQTSRISRAPTPL
ncbi:hypothetical protein OXX80_006981 [Metschnikowia pulcherrima]